MKWSRVFVNIIVLMSLLQLATTMTMTTSSDSDHKRHMASGFFERALQELVLHRRIFLDGFSNGTELLERQYYGFGDDEQNNMTGEGEGRGRRKRLRQMNRALMAIVMAFSLKFMFLIPTFVGTLILLKFTTALAGFFYALFAAVLGLDYKHN